LIDLNGDGKVSVAEMEAWHVEVGLNSSLQRAEHEFTATDRVRAIFLVSCVSPSQASRRIAISLTECRPIRGTPCSALAGSELVTVACAQSVALRLYMLRFRGKAGLVGVR